MRTCHERVAGKSPEAGLYVYTTYTHTHIYMVSAVAQSVATMPTHLGSRGPGLLSTARLQN